MFKWKSLSLIDEAARCLWKKEKHLDGQQCFFSAGFDPRRAWAVTDYPEQRHRCITFSFSMASSTLLKHLN